ncbi:MAG: class I SAM-dependent methyltransferase [Acidobacteriota bacterium]
MRSPLERRRARKTIDRLTFDVRRRFAEAGDSEDRLRRTQTPGNRRLLAVHRALDDVLPRRGPVRALELGVGHGELVVPMAELFPHTEWTAIEHPKRRYLGKASYRASLERARCQVVAGSLTAPSLPLGSESFDVATLSEVIEHLPSTALPPLLDEAHRVLRPGGHLVITTPNLLALTYRLLLLLGRSPFEPPVETSFAPETYGHIRLWSAAEVEALGRDAGFDIVRRRHETWMLGYYCFDKASMRLAERMLLALDKTLGTLRPRLRDSWLMVLRRR